MATFSWQFRLAPLMIIRSSLESFVFHFFPVAAVDYGSLLLVQGVGESGPFVYGAGCGSTHIWDLLRQVEGSHPDTRPSRKLSLVWRAEWAVSLAADCNIGSEQLS